MDVRCTQTAPGVRDGPQARSTSPVVCSRGACGCPGATAMRAAAWSSATASAVSTIRTSAASAAAVLTHEAVVRAAEHDGVDAGVAERLRMSGERGMQRGRPEVARLDQRHRRPGQGRESVCHLRRLRPRSSAYRALASVAGVAPAPTRPLRVIAAAGFRPARRRRSARRATCRAGPAPRRR